MSPATAVKQKPSGISTRLGTGTDLLETALGGLTALFAFIFLAAAFLYLALGHWSVTHLDFCRLYTICLTHSWLGSALPKFNNHSLFFPSFVWLTDLRFLHGNQQFVFWCGITLLVFTFAALITPIARDTALSRTGKIAGIVILVAANFWLGRADIIASGGFNCIASLSMAATVLAVLALHALASNSNHRWPAVVVIILAGFVASFSYSSGLVSWPTLLLLGWCLRLRPRFILLLGASGFVAAVVFTLLPDPSATLVNLGTNFPPVLATATLSTERLCRLLGSPITSALSAWQSSRGSSQAMESSPLSLFCGALGLGLAAFVILHSMIRRNLRISDSWYIGFALVVTNLLVLIIVVIGRASLIHSLPSEIAAPRYFFWSMLFWAGLLLMAVRIADRRRWTRLTSLLGTVMLLIFILPKHHAEGIRCRYAASLAQRAATSLINGVRDPQAVRILFSEPEQVYRIGEKLRSGRLDMFADGAQDWISKPAAELFQGKRDSAPIKASCRLDAYVRCNDGEPAARVSGWFMKGNGSIPATLVIVEPRGTICGIARSFSTADFTNRLLYSHKLSRTRFTGYIRHYNPTSKYTIHSADDGKLSEQGAQIPAPSKNVPTL